MANQAIQSMLVIPLVLILILFSLPRVAKSIGVCYGRMGNNMPSPADVVSLYKSNNIGAMRLYSTNKVAGFDLQALRGSNIQLILDVAGTDLQSLASSLSAATLWVKNNVLAYWPDVSIKYIAVGNEVKVNSMQYVLPAMRNVQSALTAAGLKGRIQVSTSVSLSVVGTSYPPSAGEFTKEYKSFMNPIVQFLAGSGAPLLVNVHPYYSYINAHGAIDINYALFSSPGTVVRDGQYNYQNLFDAIVDATYAAMEKAGGSNVPIVVSESGWPWAGGMGASISNAQTYNQKLIRHVGQGTPRRPGRGLETYIFAIFNENQKAADDEKYWGLFFPNMQPVYPINLGIAIFFESQESSQIVGETENFSMNSPLKLIVIKIIND